MHHANVCHLQDSVIKASKKYYPQTLLKGFKYETKKTKMWNLITDDLESSSSDNETESDSDNESEINHLLKLNAIF